MYSFGQTASGASGSAPDAKDNANLDAYKVFSVKDGTKPPRPIYTPDPEFTGAARFEKKQGTVILSMIVTPDGRVAKVQVERSLDYGLDQNAIDAVCRWKFEPATKDGKAVAVRINVDVSFRQ